MPTQSHCFAIKTATSFCNRKPHLICDNHARNCNVSRLKRNEKWAERSFHVETDGKRKSNARSLWFYAGFMTVRLLSRALKFQGQSSLVCEVNSRETTSLTKRALPALFESPPPISKFVTKVLHECFRMK